MNEASGLVHSRRNADVFWVHNDSGDSARLFAMNAQGTHLGIYSLTGAGATDWEDMASGPGPVAGEDYLYVGDIGDNGLVRANVRVYRVAEPVVASNQAPVNVALSGVETFTLNYPGGLSHNAETLLVDPVSGDLFIVSKAGSGTSRVFRKAAPHVSGTTTTMTEVAVLQFGTAPLTGSVSTTGGDVSPLGNRIIIRSYNSAYVWIRQAGTPLADAFSNPPCVAVLTGEPQGEAVSWDPAGSGYTTVSEFTGQPLNHFTEN